MTTTTTTTTTTKVKRPQKSKSLRELATDSPQLCLLSYGGGQDSDAMLKMYVYDPAFRARYAPNDFVVIMADTGNEHPETYAHVEEVKLFCKEHGVTFYHVTKDMGFHTPAWQDLKSALQGSSSVIGAGLGRKTCTINLKISPIYKMLMHHVAVTYLGRAKGRSGGQDLYDFTNRYGSRISVLIGIAKNEERRVKSIHAFTTDAETGEVKYQNPLYRRECTQVLYPLLDLGMGRQECQDYIRSVGHKVPVPSNCILCPFMNGRELLLMTRTHPNEYADWVLMEQAKREKWRAKGKSEKDNQHIYGAKPLPMVLEKAEREYGHLSTEHLRDYRNSHGHCTMSVV